MKLVFYGKKVEVGSFLRKSWKKVGKALKSRIRAVAEQCSSPELHLANKTKMHLKQKKNELKITRV